MTLAKPGRRGFVTRSAALLSASSLASCAQLPAAPRAGAARGFEFAVIGDMPYNRAQEPEYARVIDDLNARDLACVVHIGDFEFDPRPYERNPASARVPGDDATYAYVLDTFASSKHPLVLTPGDNDWADLFEMKSRSFDPIERLHRLRSMFYPRGRSLGRRTIATTSQADVDARHAAFRENQMWTIEGVTFATLHIIGSNDNVGRLPALDEEQRQRKAANLDWMQRVFATARAGGSRGLVLIAHASMGFENLWPPSYFARYYRPLTGFKAPAKAEPTAYDDYIRALSAEMEGFAMPTLWIHGDTHLLRIDKPLFSAKTRRPFENFTRVETFGWPDTHWVRVTVDPADAQLFTVRAQIVDANRQHHRAARAPESFST